MERLISLMRMLRCSRVAAKAAVSGMSRRACSRHLIWSEGESSLTTALGPTSASDESDCNGWPEGEREATHSAHGFLMPHFRHLFLPLRV